jgi:Flp pilus assembly pilin Flp
MQTITDRTQELAARSWLAVCGAARAATERARDERGQTAAEYMGLLFVIALIIGALISLEIPQKIAEAAAGLIDDISTGGTEQ